MTLHIKRAIKIIIFLLIAAVLFAICSFIAQPIWMESNNYSVTRGFYEEPENTLETVFLGASIIPFGISPMELYEKYGICAYDRGTDSQPMLASYYLLKETYRLHSETLDTVVLDVSMLRQDPDDSLYHKTLDLMELSEEKISAMWHYSEDFPEFLSNLIPLLSYHDRWESLEESDFLKFTFEPDLSGRGYVFNSDQWVNSVGSYSAISTPLRVVDVVNNDTEKMDLDSKAVEYFEKIVEFCDKNDICLVLIKTPTDWSSEAHDAVQTLADAYGLDFLDFNVDPFYSEVGYNMATDSFTPQELTNIHPNYYGAVKMTDYLGNYLVEECGNRDVRGDEKYLFMEEELENYHRSISKIDMDLIADPCDYLEYILKEGNYSIIISVKDDASSELTDAQRDYFSSIGLSELAELSFRSSYLAVVEDGIVVTEMTQADPGEAGVDGEALSFDGTLSEGLSYSVSSGGYNSEDISSIQIDGKEYSANVRGLNIVVYDNLRQEVIDSSAFDTYEDSKREIENSAIRQEELLDNGETFSELSGTDRTLYQYNRLCELEEKVKTVRNKVNSDLDLVDYLDAFWDDENLYIFISTQSDATRALTYRERSELSSMGLEELSQLQKRDAYVAVISGGEVFSEKRGAKENRLEINATDFLMTSGGENSDDLSSIIVSGTEYCEAEDGINIVVYDEITKSVVDAITFNSIYFLAETNS